MKTEAELLQAEKDCESWADLFSRRHKTRKAKRTSRKPLDFVLTVKPVTREPR